MSSENPNQSSLNEVTALAQNGATDHVVGQLGVLQTVGLDLVCDHEIIHNPFETDNFVKIAPTLVEAAKDSSRSGEFTYLPGPVHVSSGNMPQVPGEATRTTEGAAITEFLGFLDVLDQEADKVEDDPAALGALLSSTENNRKIWGRTEFDRPTARADVQQWLHRSIEGLRSTSFLGRAEFDEASAGIADYWKSYLQEDGERQICLPSLHTNSSSKSDGYVAESIFAHFTPEEREELKSRFVGQASEIVAEPDKVKVILIDDWMMSGDQMSQRKRTALITRGDLSDAGSLDKFQSSLEINLLVADENRLTKGEGSSVYYDRGEAPVPVKAYFKAPAAADASDAKSNDRYESRITGAHSTADVHFALTVSNVLEITRKLSSDKTIVNGLEMPPLTNIVRTYRQLNPVLTRQMLATSR